MNNGTKRFIMISIIIIAVLFTIIMGGAVEKKITIKTVRVGFFEFNGYHMIDANGNRSGYGYEFINNMSKFNSWKFQYIGYEKSWNENLKMLKEGAIDMLTSAQKTTEREIYFDYSKYPIGTSYTRLTVKAGNDRFSPDNEKTFEGIKVGVIENNSRNESFARYAEGKFSYTTVNFDNMDEMEKALQDGKNEKGEEIDAILTSSLRTAKNEWILAQFDPSPYYIIVKKGNKELMDEINYAIEQLNIYYPELISELNEKYYRVNTTDKIFLTSQEQAYIKHLKDSNRIIKGLIKPGHGDLSRFENGELKGILGEATKEIIRRSNLPIEIIETFSDKEYQEKLRSDDIVINFDHGQFWNSQEKEGYKFTAPYMSFKMAEIKNNSIKGEAVTAAAIKNSSVTENLVKWRFKLDQINYYDSVQACLDAVKQGKQDVTYMDEYSAKIAIERNYENTIKMNILQDCKIDIVIAIKDNESLCLMTILNKAVCSLDKEYIDGLISQNTQVDYDMPFVAYFYKYPMIMISIIVLIFFAIIIVIVAVLLQQRKKVEQEKANELSRFANYVLKVNENVFEINLSLKKRTYYTMENGVAKKEIKEEDWCQSFYPIIHPNDLNKFKEFFSVENITKVVEEALSEYMECRLLNEKGNYIWYGYSMQGSALDKKLRKCCMVFKQNVDEVKIEETAQRNQLNDALTVAQAANTAKSAFLSKMSHEIRTPLNAVIGFLALLELKNDEEIKYDYLHKAEKSAKHLLELLNEILDTSAIESGKLIINNESFDIKELINNLTEVFYTQAKQKDICFRVILKNLSDEFIIGDKLRTSQVLINLISNAIKFTKKGGVVLTVTQLMKNENNVYIKFEIADTGIGIKEENLDRIFKPFEQENGQTAISFGGTGLGLSIAKNLTEMMGGLITVQSNEGIGTTFSVDIPYGIDYNNVHQEIIYDFSKLNVLIVDDVCCERDYMQNVAAHCGVKAETVTNGYEAIEAIKTTANTNKMYDLCLLDWRMDGLDGMATAKKIREISANIPIIIVTAYDVNEVIVEVGKVGITKVISKPLFQSVMFDLLLSLNSSRKPVEIKKEIQKTSKNEKIIMVVEDNDMNMEIMVALLENKTYNVIQAKNGREAVELFNKIGDNLALILMDVQMPIMDGYTATKTIRSLNLSNAKTIPIIAMTANAFQDDISKSIASGMNEHLSKPVDTDIM
ncbi:MAG: response regulator, partial [Clostridia bacterium]